MKAYLRTAAISAALATFALTPATALAETWTKAEVRAIDAEENKITLKHEPLAEFDMPAMTMVFRVTDPTKLEGVAEGDKIEFVAGNENGQMIVKDLKKD